MNEFALRSPNTPLNVSHILRISVASTEGTGFKHISTWLKLPLASDTTALCMICGATLEMPKGNIKALLEDFQSRQAGADVIVRIEFHHKGPRPSNRPPEVSTVTDPTKIIKGEDMIQ